VPEVVGFRLRSTRVQVHLDLKSKPSSEIIVDINDRQLPSTRLVVAGLAGACRRSCLPTRPVIVGRLVSFFGSTVCRLRHTRTPVRSSNYLLLSE